MDHVGYWFVLADELVDYRLGVLRVSYCVSGDACVMTHI